MSAVEANSYNAIVVGGSFAGLSAAIYLARARRSVVVVDAGQPRNRFAAESHGFLGQDGVAPFDMIAKARAQLLAYPSVRFVDDFATDVSMHADGFTIRLRSGQALRARRLVLATGVADELPPIPGLRERWGETVIHCPYCYGFEFAGEPLGVLATGPMSVHQALLIPDWGPTTFFLNNVLTLVPDAEMRLKARNVSIETEPVARIDDASMRSGLAVRLKDGRVIQLAALYAAPVLTIASSLAHDLGCEMEDTPLGAIIKTGPDKQTTVPGVYAAGDAACMRHGVAWAVADGATAGISLHQASVADAASKRMA